jgi:hypothetical protein
MSLFTRLWRLCRFQRQVQCPCSPYGFDDWRTLSRRARSAAKCLTHDQLLAISRFSPFKVERNRVLMDLKRKGMSQAVLGELSGLSRRQVEVITNFRNLEVLEGDGGDLRK